MGQRPTTDHTVPGRSADPGDRCSVADCPGDRHGAGLLCHVHRGQFEVSGLNDVQDWLAGGGAGVFERRWCSEQRCAVTDPDGQGCPRPAEGPADLPHPHHRLGSPPAAGTGFEAFMARARPLPDLGSLQGRLLLPGRGAPGQRTVRDPLPGLAASRASRGSSVHRVWAARARQPVNSRVLSLRGLPTLVGLELLYAIGCRADDQVRRRHRRDAAVGRPATGRWPGLGHRVRPARTGRRGRRAPRAGRVHPRPGRAGLRRRGGRASPRRVGPAPVRAQRTATSEFHRDPSALAAGGDQGLGSRHGRAGGRRVAAPPDRLDRRALGGAGVRTRRRAGPGRARAGRHRTVPHPGPLTHPAPR